MAETRDRTTYIYEEYVRVHGLVHAYVKSSFSDFKMLAVVGSVATMAVKLAGPSFSPKSSDELVHITFIAFTLILAMIAIIAFRELLKQSIITGYLSHMVVYESELRTDLRMKDFGIANAARPWYKDLQLPLTHRFVAVFGSVVVLIPCAILIEIESEAGTARVLYSWIYFAIAIALALVYWRTANTIAVYRLSQLKSSPETPRTAVGSTLA
jgi:hypothetical protein